ncbi:MAG: DUF726 domain-containing protein [Cyanobacteria bacterium P01_G01_bin.54]
MTQFAKLINALFELDSDQVRRYVAKRRAQHPDLTPQQLAQRISTRKSIKNGLISASTGMFGALLLPLMITADALKSFRAEAFLLKCINAVYGIDPDDEAVNALFPLLLAADSIAEFEQGVDVFLDALWRSEENQTFMINSLKKSAFKAVVKQMPELASKVVLYQFGTAMTQQLFRLLPKQLSKGVLRMGGRKFTQRAAARAVGKAIPVVGAASGFAMDYYAIRQKAKLAMEFNEAGVIPWACDLFKVAEPQIEKIADATGAQASLIYIHEAPYSEAAQEETDPEAGHSTPESDWLCQLRAGGWQGEIYHCWWDATQLDPAIGLNQRGTGQTGAGQLQRSRIDFKKQSQFSALIGRHFLLEYIKQAIQTPQVTLMGYSLGAQAAFDSLKVWDASLPQLQDVVLLGATVHSPASTWLDYTGRVSGHIINTYNAQDLSLRTVEQWELPESDESEVGAICGLAPIAPHSAKVINVDSSHTVGQSHAFEAYLESFLATQQGQAWAEA